ncbi:hypothetical protein OESDEN_03048 [Oesophagostomum dentatum]|uniref:Uncharacterized protein n=1 Tax=Oesophagostomum dentatum TaxID=61180 RepID=A0A0B1THF1_OESDE|nr:hypothetical protein OESDEN_03048 [Oesophagostomum dentatum]
MLTSILSIAHLFGDIVRTHSQYFDDLVVQALSTSSQDIVEEYIHDVGEIPINIAKIDKSWKSMDSEKNVENFDKARNVVATQLDPRSLYILSERHKLERVVTDVCHIVCGSVVRCFVIEHHIIDHFDAAPCFLLLHDPSFSLVLYQKFCECTYGLRSKLSQRDANNALIAAAAMSPAAKHFPFRVNFDTLSSANDSPNTSSRLQFVQPLHPFYSPQEPVLKIFKDTEKRYDSLFHFIWPIDLCLFMISDSATSIGQKSLQQRNRTGSSTLKLTSSLLSCAERVLLQMRIYITEMVRYSNFCCWCG